MLEKLNIDFIKAMKSQNKIELAVIRSIKGALQLEKINNNKEITDEVFISVVDKQIKMRKDSIIEFEKGKRFDLVESYQQEIDILKKYMPEELNDEEVTKIVDDIFNKLNPASISDFGKVMKEITPLVKGRYDLSKLSNIIKERLNK